MVRIRVFAFQLEAGPGVDTVVGLKFKYDPVLIDVLKEAIAGARDRLGRGYLGGWLPDSRCWFVERVAWPLVKPRLKAAGYVLLGDPDASQQTARPGRQQEQRDRREGNHVRVLPLPHLEATLRTWYRELSLRFHPDRGGSHERQLALNVARDQLKELLGIE